MQTTEPEYTEEQFIKAYMMQDRRTLSRIIKGQCSKRNIQTDDILKAGLTVNAFNRHKREACMMKEESLPVYIELLFGEKPIQAKEGLFEYMQIINRMHNETNYRCDYEWLMDFGIQSKKLSALRLIKSNSTYGITGHIINKIDEEWPDVSILRDTLTRKPISIDDMMETIKNRFSPEYDNFANTFSINRMSEYLSGKCRMPEKLYDAAIDIIESLPPSNLQQVPGYMEYRIRILTALWYEDYDEAQEIFEQIVDGNPVDFGSIDKMHKQVKLNAKRHAKFGVLRAIQLFDDVCMSWYKSISDMTQRRMLFINSVDTILQRISFYARKGLVAPMNQELEDIRSILPIKIRDIGKYVKKKGITGFNVNNLYANPDRYLDGATKEQLISIRFTVYTVYDLVHDYMAQNSAIQLK